MEKKYQIFISSTYQDLIAERSAVIETILKLEHIPIGMEMFNAGDEGQWEIIRRAIDNSDYYILIIGFRYGSVTPDGISYTEKEYDYATMKGIPVLAFLMDRNCATTPGQREEDRKLQRRLEKFTDKVTKRKIVQFWHNKDELASQVSTALTMTIKNKPATGWVRADQIHESQIQELIRFIQLYNDKQTNQSNDPESKRVLWADDNPFNNKDIIEIFERRGVTFDLAITTKQAFHLFSEHSYDLVITDLTRGSETDAGFTLITQIIRSPRTTPPILVYSVGKSFQEYGEIVRKMGAELIAGGIGELIGKISVLLNI